MSLIIVAPNDTVVISDSITVKVTKAIEFLQPTMTEAGTNSEDVMVAIVICATLVIIALMAFITFYLWKKKELSAIEQERKDKRNFEIQDCHRKMLAELSDKIISKLNGNNSLSVETWEEYVGNLNKYIENIKNDET